MKTCGIAGQWDILSIEYHQDADLPPSGRLMELLWQLVENHGVQHFVVSMDQGGGLLAANLIEILREGWPHVRLTCVILWEEQAIRWPEPVRDEWFQVIADCDEEIMLEHHRSAENLIKRDRLLLERCDSLVLLKNPDCGLAWNLEAQAKEKGLLVRELVL